MSNGRKYFYEERNSTHKHLLKIELFKAWGIEFMGHSHNPLEIFTSL